MASEQRVLIVDDEAWNRKALARMLLPLGVEVQHAGDGIEALNSVNRKRPDLILLDAIMPNMNGIEVVRNLKRNRSTAMIPILMVTAMREDALKLEALEAGVDDFLAKPVDSLEIRARVKTLLKMKRHYDSILEYQRLLEIAVRKRTKELELAVEDAEKASLETVYRLMRAAEYKDEDTGAHIQRMGSYSAAIAAALDMPDSFIKNLLYAAPMHDLGKIGIPDDILTKPGKLTPHEWTIMKTHTEIGGRILKGSKSEFIQLAESIALTHHEKWDGTGYPAGLAGSAIPLAGRIAAIADVFDALTSSRPYRRKPLPIDEAFRIIEQGKGSHFDPDITDVFLWSREEILHIKETFQDSRLSVLVEKVQRFSSIPDAPSLMPPPRMGQLDQDEEQTERARESARESDPGLP